MVDRPERGPHELQYSAFHIAAVRQPRALLARRRGSRLRAARFSRLNSCSPGEQTLAAILGRGGPVLKARWQECLADCGGTTDNRRRSASRNHAQDVPLRFPNVVRERRRRAPPACAVTCTRCDPGASLAACAN